MAANCWYKVTALNRHQPVFVLLIFALIGASIAYYLRDLRFDDPYITYRYAENLASGSGFRFNPGETTLITTAPLYALLLTGFRIFGADIPHASFAVGAISLIGSAWVLYLLGRRGAMRLAGFTAGLILLCFPLTWLTLGFETPLFFLVALAAFLACNVSKPALAGVAVGVALGLRGDGFIILAVVMLFALYQSILNDQRDEHYLWQSTSRLKRIVRDPLLIVAVAFIVYAPLAIWLTVQFGSPFPSTLQTKSAQAVSGLTGFYPHTSYIEGGWLLVRALVMQSPGAVLLFIAALVGFVYLMRHRLVGISMLIVWAVGHVVGYTLLGVAPYVWYYAPVIPGFSLLIGLATEWLWRNISSRLLLKYGLTAAVIVALSATELVAVLPIANVLAGAIPLPPTDLRAKLMPETKVDIYERVGRWMSEYTPVTATLGVTELGVMSYYAHRDTTDFLGLTQPSHLDAIRHGDYLQALLREQPDYVALTRVNAIYDYDPQRASWFTALYTPVMSFDDSRFWGSPITIWHRSLPVVSTNVLLDDLAHDIGDGWKITAIVASTRSVQAGKPFVTRVRLQAGRPSGTRTLRLQPVLISGGDGLPVSSRLIYTGQWRSGEQDWVDFPILAPEHPATGGYVIETGWLENGVAIRAGFLKVPLDASLAAGSFIAPLSNGVGVALLSRPVTACIGATTPVTINWIGGAMVPIAYTAFVQLRAGTLAVAQADAPPRGGTYPTVVWSPEEVIPDIHQLAIGNAVTPGNYALVVGLYNPVDNARWPVDPSPYRTADGGVNIGTISVQQCP